MGTLVRWARGVGDLKKCWAFSAKRRANRENRSTVSPMTNSQAATDRINWHAKNATRGRVLAGVPRPRREEDALDAEQSAVERIARHALAALRRA